MSSSQKVTSPWELSAADNGTLRIGLKRFALRDVVRMSPSAHEERDFLASLFNYSVYLLVAAVFLILVVQAGWRERFLLATVFFAIVGFTSIADIGKAHRIKLYRLRITMRDGRQVDFTSADATVVDGLAAALRRAGVA